MSPDRAAARADVPLALTQGDPAGIGPDLALAIWLTRDRENLPAFLYLGDPAILSARAKKLGLDVPLAETDAAGAVSVFSTSLPVLPIAAGCLVTPGQPDPASAKGTIEAISRAVRLTMDGQTSAVVTNPIAKSVLYSAGFGFPGHTEFLADLAQKATGKPAMPVMMIAGPKLRVVPVTIHVPLSAVPGMVTSELILDTCRIVARDLIGMGVSHPRLALAGLNPHAGESGTMGSEDDAIIRPAVQQLQAEGIDATGPLPADTMFHDRARALYDVAICMYHDQGLIPAKALGFDDSVNVTLGLPFIRTSPDHGTAFSLAGTGTARPDSLIAALRLAHQMAGAKRQ